MLEDPWAPILNRFQPHLSDSMIPQVGDSVLERAAGATEKTSISDNESEKTEQSDSLIPLVGDSLLAPNASGNDDLRE